MESLFNPADREALSVRLAALEADTPHRWGKMNPAQMLQHCSRGLEAATGDRPMKQLFIGKILGPLVRRLALGKRPMGRNSPTDPSFVVLDVRDFNAERIRLATIIDRFVQRGPESAGKATHAFFGRMSGDEWGRLMYKHLDHHLRQFGV
ncbi:hypothetical protein GETHLI_30920 [Geothrix limicola]|uniref:DUF1569 domain-containing protein n=1 Tax=Geothrix limicola TaxID=2927978 RepID=A0ABQ5QIA9_9BACT|nr:DUF1569 domain-containing protein [Geothrix limicola]GLH74590.1 hypothetical protein GETHLI_30920 [Geothrix limicola]